MNLSRDRIKQGRFFLKKAEEVGFTDRDAFRYFIEAAIVSARSVTLILQKEYHNISGFKDWYLNIQATLKDDSLAQFLLEKRNYVLKEGIASIKKVVNVNINESVMFQSSIKLKVIRGSLKNRLRHLPEDSIYPIKEKWTEIKNKFKKYPLASENKSISSSEKFYFSEPEWSSTPAFDLVNAQFDKLELIVNDTVVKFGESSNM